MCCWDKKGQNIVLLQKNLEETMLGRIEKSRWLSYVRLLSNQAFGGQLHPVSNSVEVAMDHMFINFKRDYYYPF